MGSRGDARMQCAYCEKSGKCLDDVYPPAVSLMDVDGIGVVCDPCDERGYPVHYDYLKGLLQARLSSEIVEGIADLAYEGCSCHRSLRDVYRDI